MVDAAGRTQVLGRAPLTPPKLKMVSQPALQKPLTLLDAVRQLNQPRSAKLLLARGLRTYPVRIHVPLLNDDPGGRMDQLDLRLVPTDPPHGDFDLCGLHLAR